MNADRRGKRACTCLWVGSVVALSCAAWARSAGDGERIPNGGFERASEKDANLPAAWTPHTHGKVSVAWSRHEPHAGTRCLEMAADPNEKWGHAYWTSDAVPVRPCMAYRVRFCFRAKGHGVPCFSLSRVKSWRLFKGDTKGEWLVHEDVVVVPPDVTSTRFSVNNYNRPGKTMWLDDVSLIELPLSASPLTKRLERARRAVAAIERNLRPCRLTLAQHEDLRQMRGLLGEVESAYDKLRAGRARPADFKAIHEGLARVEKAGGAYLFAVWPAASAGGAVVPRRPTEISRSAEVLVEAGGDGQVVAREFGLMGLVDEGLPVRVSVVPEKRPAGWEARVLVTPAHRPGPGPTAWGAVGPLGSLFLPPGVPRFLRVEVQPGKAPKKLSTPLAFRATIHALDRAMQAGQITLRVRFSRAPSPRD